MDWNIGLLNLGSGLYHEDIAELGLGMEEMITYLLAYMYIYKIVSK